MSDPDAPIFGFPPRFNTQRKILDFIMTNPSDEERAEQEAEKFRNDEADRYGCDEDPEMNREGEE